MSEMRAWDAFPDKAQAKRVQRQLKTDLKHPVQHVHIKKQPGRLKYMIMIGGKNSRYW